MTSQILTISLIKDASHVVLWNKQLKELVYDYNLKHDKDLMFEISKKYQSLEFEEVDDISEIMKQLK